MRPLSPQSERQGWWAGRRAGIEEVRWWRQGSPVGELVVEAGPAGVRRIVIDGVAPIDGDPEPDDDIAGELAEYFTGHRLRFTASVDLAGVTAPFRRRVLETLRDDVGYGETVAYGELAAMAGRPGAARAVGSAMATNPVPILIPCHPVVAADGIGGYGGGLDRKRTLLALEGVEM